MSKILIKVETAEKSSKVESGSYFQPNATSYGLQSSWCSFTGYSSLIWPDLEKAFLKQVNKKKQDDLWPGLVINIKHDQK